MPRDQRTITAADMLPLDRIRADPQDKKQEAIARKRLTRVMSARTRTAMFETWDCMWLQIQEMLRIEKGGEAQVADELAAYDPMVPKGRELTCTLLFEVADPARRDAFLRTIGGVEHHVALQLGGERIAARVRRRYSSAPARATTRPARSISSTSISAREQVAAWQSGEGNAMLVIDHPNYGHAATIGSGTRSYLARECFACQLLPGRRPPGGSGVPAAVSPGQETGFRPRRRP